MLCGTAGQMYWLIGYRESFDNFIIGENTESYLDFPDYEYLKTIDGNFYYVENFISRYFEDKKLSVIKEPACSKCPYLNDLKRFPLPDIPFVNFWDIFLSLKEEITQEYLKRLRIKIHSNPLDSFLIH
ncbi:hypothetical protein KAT80_01645 [Candidatus Pacearchaeota archaeon]|nr:hypothetical protein [Candidatus Pacearchaeota archaeon]